MIIAGLTTTMAKHSPRTTSPDVSGARIHSDAPSPERRKKERVRAVLQVFVKSAKQAEYVELRSHDLSSGGTFVMAQSPLRLGTLVKFRPGNVVGIEGVGRVVWSRTLSHSSLGEPPGMAIKFIGLNKRSKGEIEQFVASMPRDPARSSDPPSGVQERQSGTPPALSEPESGEVPVRVTQPALPPVSAHLLGGGGVPGRKRGPGYGRGSTHAILPVNHAPDGGDTPVDPVSSRPPPLLPRPARDTRSELSSAANWQDEGSGDPTLSDLPSFDLDGPELQDATLFVEDACDPEESAAARVLSVRPVRVIVSQRRPTIPWRKACVAAVAFYGLGALGWATWEGTSPTRLAEPVVITARRVTPDPFPSGARTAVTHAAGSEANVAASRMQLAPAERPLPGAEPTELGARAGSHPGAKVPSTASALPVRRGLAPRPHVLHVESEPPGAWIIVAGRKAHTPAVITLPDHRGKRLPISIGLFRHMERVVVVPSDQFHERDGVWHADIHVALARDRRRVPSRE